jgi:hypothetical protein
MNWKWIDDLVCNGCALGEVLLSGGTEEEQQNTSVSMVGVPVENRHDPSRIQV